MKRTNLALIGALIGLAAAVVPPGPERMPADRDQRSDDDIKDRINKQNKKLNRRARRALLAKSIAKVKQP